jgi:hypothetical protein
MHICPEEIAAAVAVVTAGPLLMYRYCRHQIGCFCRWCARRIKR